MSINLWVQWWQSCDNSYNFNQIKFFLHKWKEKIDMYCTLLKSKIIFLFFQNCTGTGTCLFEFVLNKFVSGAGATVGTGSRNRSRSH